MVGIFYQFHLIKETQGSKASTLAQILYGKLYFSSLPQLEYVISLLYFFKIIFPSRLMEDRDDVATPVSICYFLWVHCKSLIFRTGMNGLLG